MHVFNMKPHILEDERVCFVKLLVKLCYIVFYFGVIVIYYSTAMLQRGRNVGGAGAINCGFQKCWRQRRCGRAIDCNLAFSTHSIFYYSLPCFQIVLKEFYKKS